MGTKTTKENKNIQKKTPHFLWLLIRLMNIFDQLTDILILILPLKMGLLTFMSLAYELFAIQRNNSYFLIYILLNI